MSAPTLPSLAARPLDAAPAAPGTRAAFAAALRRAPWRWTGWNAALWLAVTALFAGQNAARMPAASPGRLLAGTAASFLPCALLTPAVALLALRFRFREGERRRAAAAHAAGALAFAVVGGAMMGALAWALPWSDRGAGVVEAMRRSILAFLAVDVLIYAMIVAGVLALAYARESREGAVRAAHLQARLAEARLHALSAQLHPHFLFNTLHAISSLVRHDPLRAEQLIARLSELLRHTLEGGERIETTLEEEVALLAKYVEIQEARYGPRLRVVVEVAPAVRARRVPRLILQPLVENAILHGVSRRAGPGLVEVAARDEGGALVLTVRDDGAGVPPGGPAREGVGLSSTRARLRELYGDAHAFTIAPADPRGTACTLRIGRGAAAPAA